MLSFCAPWQNSSRRPCKALKIFAPKGQGAAKERTTIGECAEKKSTKRRVRKDDNEIGKTRVNAEIGKARAKAEIGKAEIGKAKAKAEIGKAEIGKAKAKAESVIAGAKARDEYASEIVIVIDSESRPRRTGGGATNAFVRSCAISKGTTTRICVARAKS